MESPRKRLLFLESSENLLYSLQVKDMKWMAKSKKNCHLDIESKTVNANFIGLEKLILS